MRNTVLLASVLALTTAGAAIAQSTAPATTPPATTGSTTTAPKSTAECESSWKQADGNNDGRLDATEMRSSQAMLPASVKTKTTLTKQEFVTACSTG